MDPTRPVHSAHAAAESSALAPATGFLNRPTNMTNSLNSPPPNPFNIPSEQSLQPFTSPVQVTAACAAQPAKSQMQPLSQALKDPSRVTGVPVAAQGSNPETNLPRSEIALATQQTASLYPHQVDGVGGPTATAPFLQDFNLVAEAAKRAQMSIVMRDLESVSL